MIFFAVYNTIYSVIKLSESAVKTAPKKKLSERKGYKIYKKIRSIILTLVLLLALIIMVFTVIARISGNTPTFFGHSVFRVSSGSMKPAYEVGDVIIVKETDPMKLNVGDVCTYNGTTGEFAGKIITHRVIKAAYKENGEYYIQTKGDANPNEDPPINVKDVVGKVETKIGILRTLYNFFITPLGLITIIALIIAAFFNEIINFVKSIIGIGYDENKKDSVEDIIARYKDENKTDTEE